MSWYEMNVVVETISVRAQSIEKAEEMYARWNGCGESNVCPHHPDTEVLDSDWACGCASTDQEVFHITARSGKAEL